MGVSQPVIYARLYFTFLVDWTEPSFVLRGNHNYVKRLFLRFLEQEDNRKQLF
jgi:hypothetical protein